MVTPALELKGQVALVTGGALNIGRAICLDLADAGAAVCVNAHSSDQAARDLVSQILATGGQAFFHRADITDEDAVEAMVGEVVSRYGDLNILINNYLLFSPVVVVLSIVLLHPDSSLGHSLLQSNGQEFVYALERGPSGGPEWYQVNLPVVFLIERFPVHAEQPLLSMLFVLSVTPVLNMLQGL